MRILLIYGQMDRPEAAVIKKLAAQGHELKVLCDFRGPHHQGLLAEPLSIEHMICHNRLDPFAISKVAKELRHGNYDIVHAHTSRTLSVALFASGRILNWNLSRRPKIVAYRGAIGHVKRYDPTNWLTYWNSRVDQINCVSRAVEDYLAGSGVRPEKLVTIYKGHELDWYAPKTELTREQLGIPADAFLVGCVANMRREKGIDILLAAAQRLRGIPNLHFVLVGKLQDSFAEEFAKHAEGNERIHFLGFREDAPAITRLLDVFVMASRDREGLPKAVIEAMAQGIAPIVTTVGGMKELVRDDLDGLVISPEDTDALTEAIAELYRDPERRMRLGAAARTRIESEFSNDQTFLKTLSLYRTLVSETSGSTDMNSFTQQSQ